MRYCYEHHLNAMCKKFKKCPKCLKLYCTEKDEHECGVGYCYICHEKHPNDEHCYITPIGINKKGKKKEKQRENKKAARIIAFDFEVIYFGKKLKSTKI